MQDLDFCKKLLGLDDPWLVEAMEIDEPSNRLDIYLGFGDGRKKGLFGGHEQPRCPRCHTELPRTRDYQAITLRHLPIAGIRTFLHVPPPDSIRSSLPQCVCMRQWAAAAGSKFSAQMQEFVALILEATPSNQMAAKIAGISPSDAREISEQTGTIPSGRAAVAGYQAAKVAPEAIHDFDLVESGKVPPADHDGWQRLINGDIPIQTDSVALRMLLQRVRSNLERNPSRETRLAGAHSLRQFFIKHQQQLRHEIDLLIGERHVFSSRATPAVATAGIPAETDAVWKRLIHGDLRLDTRIVGLQMMIERVRQSVEYNVSAANELAGVRILRQFFGKHRTRLGHELNQLRGTPAAIAAPAELTPVNQPLPAERDPVWQKLIQGEFSIESDVLSLKMLLERIRQAINKNPTEGNRIAGAKILRQYFVKNRRRHEFEIRQLIAGASATPLPGVASAAALPPYDHPNWQRLIKGDIAIHSDAVSLKMLLERIRQAIAKKPTTANRMAGAKMLRQYFSKNQHRHAVEINALAGIEPPLHEPATEDEGGHGIPGINHPSWQRLINGELEILTDAVGLKMMLERIRLSIEHNPSEASRLAGAKILRQYFIKHQHKHRAELDQLRAA